MSQIGLHAGIVAGTAIIFLLTLVLNEAVFTGSELVRGVNWVYLPAGIRLLGTLLFGGAGAIGILIASWLACVYYYFPDDLIRSTAGSIISALAPYLVYLMARKAFGLASSLRHLTPLRLLCCAAAFAAANALLHFLWAVWQLSAHPFDTSLVMFIGDFFGSLLVLYIMKAILSLAPRQPFTSPRRPRYRAR
jgi:hypothetical protein